MKKIFFAIFMLALVGAGCSSRIQLSTNDLQEAQTVKVEMRSGETVGGEIVRADSEIVVVKDTNGKNWRAKKSDITRITGPEPVYDVEHKIISETEIANEKNSSNTWLYALGGGGLTLGASFFLASMISRGSDGDLNNGMIWGVTGVCTTVGTYLFSRKGAQIDRSIAVDKIKDKRAQLYDNGVNSEQQRRKEIQDEIFRLKKEREKQQAEMKALKEKVKSKEDK